jgi:fatty acid desaturase
MRNPEAIWLLRYPIDVYSVGVSLTVLVLQVLAWWRIDDIGWLAVAVALYLPLQSMTIPITHNHYHLRTFLWRPLNRIFEFVLFWQSGLPSFGWELNHNLGHHRNYRNHDLSSPDHDEYYWKEADDRTTPQLIYTFRTAALSHYYAYRNGRRRHPVLLRKYLMVMLIHLAVLGTMLAVRPLNTVVVFVVPIGLMMLTNAWTSYYHHVGLTGADDFSSSHTNLNKWTNIFTFNTGYHAAHHINPAIHWSKLPEFHASIASRIPPHTYRNGLLPAGELEATAPGPPERPAAAHSR